MKRNSKGFTLIELLGAIVILGILIGVTVPIIVSLLDTSRNKMYINDAKKLVTQAEYKLKSNSSSIEKPDEGDCIAVSMVYLDSSDFDNPPNEGSYEKESSFVIIKNNGGKLEYSVTIVEKLKKGGYKGVELVRDSVLLGNNALSHVVNFKKSDLIKIETDVNKGYINEKLGDGYISADNNLTAIYNYPDLDDSSSNNDIAGIPRITMASLISTSSKGYNSLDATLQLKVEDKDTTKSNLNVYISGIGYNEALSSTPLSYGENDTFSYNVNFGGAPFNKVYDGSSVKLYIVVKDPEGNSTKKTMTYKIHNNEAPEIDKSSAITKRNSDTANMTVGLVKLVVTDDIDDNRTLKVCFKESSTNEDFNTCDNYQDYNNYFNSENLMEYRFTTCNNGTCSRDGSKHYLTIFVKDTLGGITKKKFTYNFSTNTAPVINTLSVQSQKEQFTNTGSKTVVVNISAEDDIDNNDQMTVSISDGNNTSSYRYSTQPIYFTIDAPYDGRTVNLTIKVIDSEQLYTEQTKQYTLYDNQKPDIKSFTVTSSGAVCNNHALCPPETGGNKIANVSLEAEDDIDYENNFANLSVCLSLTDNSSTCGNYVSYSEFNNKTYTYNIDGDYDGSTKTIYAFVKDSSGKVSKKSYDYKLYKNQAPTIEYAMFDSKTNENPTSGNLNTVFTINAYDDFDDVSALKLQVIEDGVVKINNANLTDYLDKENDYTMSGSYNGTDRSIEVKVIDSEGSVRTKTVEYDVYEGKGPDVELFNVYSSDIPCNNEMYCPAGDGGNYNAYYKIKLKDDLDSDNDLQVCISETDSCSNYSSYTNYLEDDGSSKEINYVFSVADANKPYDGTVKELNLFAKDSDGNITKSSYSYTLYNNKGPEVIDGPEILTNVNNPDFNAQDATYSLSVDDDFDDEFQIKYCYKKDGGSEVCTDYEEYRESKRLDRTFFNESHPNGQVYNVYAKIKDSYGKVTTTQELEYRLSTDLEPVILTHEDSNLVVSATTLQDDDDNQFTRIKFAVSVDDPYDTYSVCISEGTTSCTEFSGVYEANDCVHSLNEMCPVKTNYVYYDMYRPFNNGREFNIIIYVKDSYGNVTGVDAYTGIYHSCNEYSVDNINYEYTFTDTENDPISMNRCQGMCYYSDESGAPNNFFSKYEARIMYFDKFTNVACNSSNPDVQEMELNCSHIECFNKGNNYERNAIGTRLYEDTPWTANVNGNEYICTGHYNLYRSSYTNGNANITLTKQNNNICKEAYDAHEYDFDSSSADPYVRIED